MLRFAIYWVLVMALSAEAGLEKALHGQDNMFWILIGGAVFCWLAARGDLEEDREKRKKENPF